MKIVKGILLALLILCILYPWFFGEVDDVFYIVVVVGILIIILTFFEEFKDKKG
ncbi:hypothetical protein JCM19029_08700 [Salinicoccus sesuvii]